MTLSTWIMRAEGVTSERMTDGNLLYSAACGILNGSDAEVVVRRILVESSMGMDPNSCPTSLSIYRTTAQSGGTALTVVPLDTNNAALPAQVLVAKHAVVTRNDLHRRAPQLRGMLPGPSTAPAWGGREGWLSPIASWRRSVAAQPLVLREGEGMVWTHDGASSRHLQYGSMIIRVQSTNATYAVFARPLPTAETDNMIAVFNGTGSGVVLEVFRVDSNDVGYAGFNGTDVPSGLIEATQSPPSWRLLYGDSLWGGDIITPAALDTNNVLPSGITCLMNGLFTQPGMVGGRPIQEGKTEDGDDAAHFHPLGYLQRIGVLRGFYSHPNDAWGAGSANFPRYMVGAGMRRLYGGRCTDGALSIKKNQSLVLANWFREDPPQNSVDPLSGTAQHKDATIATWSNFNITMEFTVHVGAGTVIGPASPSGGVSVIA